MKKLILTAALTIGAAFSQTAEQPLAITHAKSPFGTAFTEVYGENEYDLYVKPGSTEELGADTTISIRTTDGQRYTQVVRFRSRTKPVRISFAIGDRIVEQVNVTQKGDTGFATGPNYAEAFPFGWWR